MEIWTALLSEGTKVGWLERMWEYGRWERLLDIQWAPLLVRRTGNMKVEGRACVKVIEKACSLEQRYWEVTSD